MKSNINQNADANVMGDTEVSAFADFENPTDIESNQIVLVEEDVRQQQAPTKYLIRQEQRTKN